MGRFAVKQAQFEILERFASVLEEMKHNATHEYKIVGKESEQARSWKTDELLWEDEEHTIPKYRDKWAEVELSEDEIPEDKKAMLKAIELMDKAIEKMV